MLTKQIINILIAGEGQSQFAQSIGSKLESSQAFQLTLTQAANMGLLAEIERVHADLIVLLQENCSVPGIASQIFDEYPGLVVIVFNQVDGEAVICKQSITEVRLHSENLIELLQRVSSDETFEYWGKSN